MTRRTLPISASPHPRVPASSCSARRAFTLIELLVVIGIILVLIAIVVVGLRHVNNTAARHETVAEMKICTDTLKEYQSVNGLKNIDSDVAPPQPIQLPPAWGSSSATGTYSSGSYTLPIFVDPPAPGTNELKSGQPQSTLLTTDTTLGGTLGDMGDKAGVAGPRWSANAIRWTQAVMYILLKDPKNRTLISALPPKRILETPPSLNPGTPNPNPFTVDAAVPLDGWGNPIIFVPRGGIHVYLNPTNASTGPTEYIIRSSGTYLLTGGTVPALSANDHPFFASAGQDGFFTDPNNSIDYAIDNLYSFQDQ